MSIIKIETSYKKNCHKKRNKKIDRWPNWAFNTKTGVKYSNSKQNSWAVFREKKIKKWDEEYDKSKKSAFRQTYFHTKILKN